MLNQQIVLSLTPGAMRPESAGIVCGIRVSESVLGSGHTKRGVTLAVQFVRLSAGDEQVVAMWMSEGRARSNGLHLVAALVAQESEEALIETQSRQPAVAQAGRARGTLSPNRPYRERRRQQRITVGLSTQISLKNVAGHRLVSGATTTDLTPNGACVRLTAGEDLLGFGIRTAMGIATWVSGNICGLPAVVRSVLWWVRVCGHGRGKPALAWVLLGRWVGGPCWPVWISPGCKERGHG